MKKMNKIIAIITMFIILCSLTGCSLSYDMDHYKNFDVGYSEWENSAFVATIDWEYDSSLEIVIPSYHKEIPIEELGGYFGRGCPSSFSISVNTREIFPSASKYYLIDVISYEELENLKNKYQQAEVIDYTFTITLPDRLNKIEFVNSHAWIAEYQNDDGSIVSAKIFAPTLYFHVTEDNKTFYTENGYLYYKNSKQLVNEFFYSKECGSAK